MEHDDNHETMSSQAFTAFEPPQKSWADGFVNFTEKLGIVITGFALVTSILYYAFIQTPITNINGRIDKIETQLQNVNKLQQSVVVIEERTKNMNDDLKEIKQELQKR